MIGAMTSGAVDTPILNQARAVDRPRPVLSAREVDVLVAWLRAETKEEVAAVLFIAPSTVSTHIARVRSKYSAVGRPAHSKVALLARAIQDGYLRLRDL